MDYIAIMNENKINERFDNSALSRELCTAYVMLSDGLKIQSKINNMSSIDMGITIPTDEYKNLIDRNLTILFPLLNTMVIGLCAQVDVNSNATMSVKLNINDQLEQSKISSLLANFN